MFELSHFKVREGVKHSMSYDVEFDPINFKCCANKTFAYYVTEELPNGFFIFFELLEPNPHTRVVLKNHRTSIPYEFQKIRLHILYDGSELNKEKSNSFVTRILFESECAKDKIDREEIILPIEYNVPLTLNANIKNHIETFRGKEGCLIANVTGCLPPYLVKWYKEESGDFIQFKEHVLETEEMVSFVDGLPAGRYKAKAGAFEEDISDFCYDECGVKEQILELKDFKVLTIGAYAKNISTKCNSDCYSFCVEECNDCEEKCREKCVESIWNTSQNGSEDGHIFLDISSGNAPYNIYWDGPFTSEAAAQTAASELQRNKLLEQTAGNLNISARNQTGKGDLLNVSAGWYGVKVTDRSKQEKVAVTQLIEPPLYQAIIENIQEPTSRNANDGVINLKITGETPSFEIEITRAQLPNEVISFNDKQVIKKRSAYITWDNLVYGEYEIKIKDCTGLAQTLNVNLERPEPLIVQIEKVDCCDPDCNCNPLAPNEAPCADKEPEDNTCDGLEENYNEVIFRVSDLGIDWNNPPKLMMPVSVLCGKDFNGVPPRSHVDKASSFLDFIKRHTDLHSDLNVFGRTYIDITYKKVIPRSNEVEAYEVTYLSYIPCYIGDETCPPSPPVGSNPCEQPLQFCLQEYVDSGGGTANGNSDRASDFDQLNNSMMRAELVSNRCCLPKPPIPPVVNPRGGGLIRAKVLSGNEPYEMFLVQMNDKKQLTAPPYETEFYGLKESEYTLVTTDSRGQRDEKTIRIDAPSDIEENARLEITDAEDCFGYGRIEIIHDIRDDFDCLDCAYEYVWSTGENTKYIVARAGEYYVDIIPQEPCCHKPVRLYATITEPECLTIETEIIIDRISFCEDRLGNAGVNVLTGNGGYAYNWDTECKCGLNADENLSLRAGFNEEAFRANLQAGIYFVTVIDVKGQCACSDPIEITIPDNICIENETPLETEVSIFDANDGIIEVSLNSSPLFRGNGAVTVSLYQLEESGCINQECGRNCEPDNITNKTLVEEVTMPLSDIERNRERARFEGLAPGKYLVYGYDSEECLYSNCLCFTINNKVNPCLPGGEGPFLTDIETDPDLVEIKVGEEKTFELRIDLKRYFCCYNDGIEDTFVEDAIYEIFDTQHPKFRFGNINSVDPAPSSDAFVENNGKRLRINRPTEADVNLESPSFGEGDSQIVTVDITYNGDNISEDRLVIEGNSPCFNDIIIPLVVDVCCRDGCCEDGTCCPEEEFECCCTGVDPVSGRDKLDVICENPDNPLFKVCCACEDLESRNPSALAEKCSTLSAQSDEFYEDCCDCFDLEDITRYNECLRGGDIFELQECCDCKDPRNVELKKEICRNPDHPDYNICCDCADPDVADIIREHVCGEDDPDFLNPNSEFNRCCDCGDLPGDIVADICRDPNHPNFGECCGCDDLRNNGFCENLDNEDLAIWEECCLDKDPPPLWPFLFLIPLFLIPFICEIPFISRWFFLCGCDDIPRDKLCIPKHRGKNKFEECCNCTDPDVQEWYCNEITTSDPTYKDCCCPDGCCQSNTCDDMDFCCDCKDYDPEDLKAKCNAIDTPQSFKDECCKECCDTLTQEDKETSFELIEVNPLRWPVPGVEEGGSPLNLYREGRQTGEMTIDVRYDCCKGEVDNRKIELLEKYENIGFSIDPSSVLPEGEDVLHENVSVKIIYEKNSTEQEINRVIDEGMIEFRFSISCCGELSSQIIKQALPICCNNIEYTAELPGSVCRPRYEVRRYFMGVNPGRIALIFKNSYHADTFRIRYGNRIVARTPFARARDTVMQKETGVDANNVQRTLFAVNRNATLNNPLEKLGDFDSYIDAMYNFWYSPTTTDAQRQQLRDGSLLTDSNGTPVKLFNDTSYLSEVEKDMSRNLSYYENANYKDGNGQNLTNRNQLFPDHSLFYLSKQKDRAYGEGLIGFNYAPNPNDGYFVDVEIITHSPINQFTIYCPGQYEKISPFVLDGGRYYSGPCETKGDAACPDIDFVNNTNTDDYFFKYYYEEKFYTYVGTFDCEDGKVICPIPARVLEGKNFSGGNESDCGCLDPVGFPFTSTLGNDDCNCFHLGMSLDGDVFNVPFVFSGDIFRRFDPVNNYYATIDYLFNSFNSINVYESGLFPANIDRNNTLKLTANDSIWSILNSDDSPLVFNTGGIANICNTVYSFPKNCFSCQDVFASPSADYDYAAPNPSNNEVELVSVDSNKIINPLYYDDVYFPGQENNNELRQKYGFEYLLFTGPPPYDITRSRDDNGNDFLLDTLSYQGGKFTKAGCGSVTSQGLYDHCIVYPDITYEVNVPSQIANNRNETDYIFYDYGNAGNTSNVAYYVNQDGQSVGYYQIDSDGNKTFVSN